MYKKKLLSFLVAVCVLASNPTISKAVDAATNSAVEQQENAEENVEAIENNTENQEIINTFSDTEKQDTEAATEIVFDTEAVSEIIDNTEKADKESDKKEPDIATEIEKNIKVPSEADDKKETDNAKDVLSEIPESTEISATKTDSLEELNATVKNSTDGKSLFSSKRLIVVSDNPDFNTCNAAEIAVYNNIYALSYTNENDCENAYNTIKNSGEVQSIEPDVILETEESSDLVSGNYKKVDTKLKEHLDSLQGIAEIKVAVLDTGLDKEKSDASRITDGNINLSLSGEQNTTYDDNGHGTDIANIILSNSNSNVKIIPIKVADKDGRASMFSVYTGIQKAVELGANVINISMNTMVSATSGMLADAINQANNSGIAVVVSAGNNSADVKTSAPANVDSAIVVSALGTDNQLASYSNFGSTIDYCAYGDYNNRVGTSYSAAYVAGILADVMSKGEDIQTIDTDLDSMTPAKLYGKGLVSLFKYEQKNPTASTDKDKLTEDYTGSIFGNKDWKTLSDAELDNCLRNAEEVYVAYWLQTLSENDFENVISKPTILTETYTPYVLNENGDKVVPGTSYPYYTYLLSIDFSDMTVSTFKAKNGYFTVKISGDGKSSNIRVKGAVPSTDNQTQQTITWSTVSGSTTNNHSFALSSSTFKTQRGSSTSSTNSTGTHATVNGVTVYQSKSYGIFIGAFTYTKPAYYYISWDTSTSGGAADHRFNTHSYNWQNTKAGTHNNKGVCKSAVTETINFQVNCANLGIRTDADSTSTHGVFDFKLNHPKLKITYDKNDGTIGANPSKSIATTEYSIVYDNSTADDVHNIGTFALSKSGKHAKPNAEWNTKPDGTGTSFDMDASYKATQYKDFTSGTLFKEQTMVLYANWESHSFTSKTTTATYLKSAATCTTKAVYYYKCTGCNEKGTTTYENGSALGHDISGVSYTQDVAPTCTTAGSKSQHCKRCGAKQNVTSVAALGHATPSDWSYATQNGITNGLQYKNCTRCSTRLVTNYLQTLKYRLENADGTWGTYTDDRNVYYASGATVPAWSRQATTTHKSASLAAYTANNAYNKTVDVHRNTYTVTLNKGTGIASVSGDGSYRHGAVAVIKAFLNDGYHWVNWTGAATLENISESITVNEDKTYTANAVINSSTLKIDPNGGVWNNYTTTQTYTKNYGQTLDIPEPTRKGYSFASWSRSGTNGTIPSLKKASTYTYGVKNNATDILKATWTPYVYKVQYNGNGSTSGTMKASEHEIDAAAQLTANAFKNEYTVTCKGMNGDNDKVVISKAEFDGWAATANGEKKYADKASVKNLTYTNNGTVNLYAKWKTRQAVALPNAVKTGYSFKGWYTAESGGKRIGGAGDSYTPSGDTVLYAQWGFAPVHVIVPKQIIMGTDGNCSFYVQTDAKKGNVKLSIEDTFHLTQTNKNKKVTAHVSSDFTTINNNHPKATVKVSAENMTAGKWKGNFVLGISYNATN